MVRVKKREYGIPGRRRVFVSFTGIDKEEVLKEYNEFGLENPGFKLIMHGFLHNKFYYVEIEKAVGDNGL